MNVINRKQVDVTLTEEVIPNLSEKVSRAKFAQQKHDEQLKPIRDAMGVGEVCPQVDESELKKFLDIAVTDKGKAIEVLILNSILGSNSKKSMSFELLSSISHSTDIRDIKKKQRIAIVEVIADAADEMSKLTGKSARNIYEIDIMCTLLAKKFLKSLSYKKRSKVLLRILRGGKATSWVVSFATRVFMEHRLGDTDMGYFTPWLEEDVLEEIKSMTKERVEKIMRSDWYSTADPLSFFLFGLQIGDLEETNRLSKRVSSIASSDEGFVRLVDVFSGSALLKNGTYFPDEITIVYTETLSQLIEIETVVERLRKIGERSDSVGKTSRELLETVKYTLSARERGLKISSTFYKYCLVFDFKLRPS